MERVSLEAVARTEVGKNAVKKVRKSGLVPAVLYGRARTPLSLALGRKDLVGALQTGGRNVLIDLRIRRNGQAETETVMISEIQRDHLRSEILHVDLHQINLAEALEARVPVVLVGTPEGAAEGGILDHHLREITVRCLPTQIPDRLTLDVAALKIGDALHVSDLRVPGGIEVLTAPEGVIVSVLAPTEEEVAAPAPAEGVVEPELVGRAAAEPAEGEAKPEAPARAEAKTPKAEPKPPQGDRPARSEKKE